MARATLECALERRETRGAHNRDDFLVQDPALRINLVWTKDGLNAHEPIAEPFARVAALRPCPPRSRPDLILSVTLECSILTTVTNVGTSTATATGQVRAWTEVDGQIVPVQSISQYQATKNANAFNWLRQNVGAGQHTITVKADLSSSAMNGTAEAIVGNRTLVVDPTKMANDAVISSGTG